MVTVELDAMLHAADVGEVNVPSPLKKSVPGSDDVMAADPTGEGANGVSAMTQPVTSGPAVADETSVKDTEHHEGTPVSTEVITGPPALPLRHVTPPTGAARFWMAPDTDRAAEVAPAPSDTVNDTLHVDTAAADDTATEQGNLPVRAGDGSAVSGPQDTASPAAGGANDTESCCIAPVEFWATPFTSPAGMKNRTVWPNLGLTPGTSLDVGA
jgi:hypothetical protein